MRPDAEGTLMTSAVRKRILVLEDDEDLIHEYRTGFGLKGHEVYVGTEGLKELMASGKGMPQLIILDAAITHMNGYVFFQSFKRDPELSKIPVMIITARAGLKESYLKLGCNFFGVKPMTVDAVLEKATELMIKKLLFLEANEDARERIRKDLPKSFYHLVFLGNTNEIFRELGELEYDSLICSLSLIKEEPKEFVEKAKKAAKNPRMKMLVYVEEAKNSDEADDVLAIAALERQWRNVGSVLFYDARSTREPLREFLVLHV